jgi:MFS family permease
MDVSILTLGLILTMYFAGRIAERRGRSFKNWALIAGTLIGPLALPLLFLLPNLQRRDPGDPEGEQRPTDATRATKPAVQGHPDPGRLEMPFSFR